MQMFIFLKNLIPSLCELGFMETFNSFLLCYFGVENKSQVAQSCLELAM